VLSALRSCHDLDYRARPKTDRIACPWLIRRFIDPDATIVYVPADQVLTAAAEQGAHSFDAPGDAYTYQAAPDGTGEWCTFETLIAAHQLGNSMALSRLAAIVHAADIDADLHTDPLGPGLLAIGVGGLDVESDDQTLLERGMFAYDALRLVHPPDRRHHDRGMSSGRLDADAIRAAAVRQVAILMPAAAITAPKSGGQLFLAGKPAFLETVIIDDPATRVELATWMRARGRERREPIWLRDAEVAEAVTAILFLGLAPNWYPPTPSVRLTGRSNIQRNFRSCRLWWRDERAPAVADPDRARPLRAEDRRTSAVAGAPARGGGPGRTAGAAHGLRADRRGSCAAGFMPREAKPGRYGGGVLAGPRGGASGPG